jgi:hypothetical protein
MPVADHEFQEKANKYAESAISSLREMLDALNHARECDGQNDEGEECKVGADSDNADNYHNEDDAQRAIDEDPLSVERDKGERFDGTLHYEILLTTGGPAARITGELEDGQPSTAFFEYQDWFKPWTRAWVSAEDEKTLLEYAQQFYFGE